MPFCPPICSCQSLFSCLQCWGASCPTWVFEYGPTPSTDLIITTFAGEILLLLLLLSFWLVEKYYWYSYFKLITAACQWGQSLKKVLGQCSLTHLKHIGGGPIFHSSQASSDHMFYVQNCMIVFALGVECDSKIPFIL